MKFFPLQHVHITACQLDAASGSESRELPFSAALIQGQSGNSFSFHRRATVRPTADAHAMARAAVTVPVSPDVTLHAWSGVGQPSHSPDQGPNSTPWNTITPEKPQRNTASPTSSAPRPQILGSLNHGRATL